MDKLKVNRRKEVKLASSESDVNKSGNISERYNSARHYSAYSNVPSADKLKHIECSRNCGTIRTLKPPY